MRYQLYALSLVLLIFGTALTAHAQHTDKPLVDRKPDSPRESDHREGLHVNPVAAYAIVGAVVHRSPTAEPQAETVLVSEGKILAVGADKPRSHLPRKRALLTGTTTFGLKSLPNAT